MTVTFLQFSGTTWLQEATDDLASQAMLSLLLVVLTDCFVRFRGAGKSRISTTRAENVTQYLLITWRLGVYQRRFNQTLFLFLENKLTWLAGDFCQTCVRQWYRFVLDWIGYALVSRKTLLDNLGLLTIQFWDFFVSLTAAIDTPCVIPRFLLDSENTAAFSHCFLSWLVNRYTWRRWSLKESNSGLPQYRAISLEFIRHLYHISYFPVYIALLIKFDIITSFNPILVNRDVILGRCRVDVGLMWGRCRVDVWSMWGQWVVDVGSMWGRHKGSMWSRCQGRCGVDVRSIIIYEGERLVTPPLPILFKRGALLSEDLFPIRTRAVQIKNVEE